MTTSTMTLIAPVGLSSIEARSGVTYNANNLRQMLNVSLGDAPDLLHAGCTSFDDVEQGASAPWAVGKFYGINPGDTLAAVLTATALIYAYPVFIPNPITIKTFNLNVTTGNTGGAAHCGIYADVNGAPGPLVVESGAFAAATTAVATATLATPFSLLPGWYWFASAFTASSTFSSVAGITAALAGGVNGFMGGDTAAHALAVAATGSTSGVTATFTYGSLPASFPSAGFAPNVNASTPAFAVGL